MSTSKRPRRPVARYVTAAQIKREGACPGALELFEQLFGKGGKVRVTERTATALAGSLNPTWAVDNLLTYEQRAVFTRALPEQLRTFAAAERPYDRSIQLMRGLQSTTEIDPNTRKIIPTTFSVVESMVEQEQVRRRRMAQAAAFAIAYNSPKRGQP